MRRLTGAGRHPDVGRYSASSVVKNECRPRGHRTFTWITGPLVPAIMSRHSTVAGSPQAGQNSAGSEAGNAAGAAEMSRSVRAEWVGACGRATATKVVIASHFLSLEAFVPSRKGCPESIKAAVGWTVDRAHEFGVPQSEDAHGHAAHMTIDDA
jgi:hypothetical protein